MSEQLAKALFAGNQEYGEFYPAQVGNRMSNTDSASFMNVAPSVSLRENQRIVEIGNGSQPNWHQSSDLFSTYSEADYIFGLNIVQTTLGTLAEVAGLKVTEEWNPLAHFVDCGSSLLVNLYSTVSSLVQHFT
jgi:hypothetical protein